MSNNLTPTAQTIVLVACLFIFFLNLSLVFAFLRRGRDQAAMQQKRPRSRMPWESRLDESSAELARRVAALRQSPPGEPPPEGDQHNERDTPG